MNPTIKLLASELEEGESRYFDCPSCGRPKKFSMTNVDGRVLWHCFRPSCDLYRGGITSTTGARLVHTRSEPRKQAFTPYEGELEPLTEEWEDYLEDKIGWTQEHRDVARPMYAPEEHRIAFPIFSPLGRRRGWCLRSYSGGEPKGLTRMDAEEPHMAWYMTHVGIPTALVVEDIPSAVRASKYCNAVALLGTGCNPDYAQEIAAHVRSVVWALDADATAHAIKLHRKYQLMFDSSTVLTLDQDLKDMSEEDVCERVGKFGS